MVLSRPRLARLMTGLAALAIAGALIAAPLAAPAQAVDGTPTPTPTPPEEQSHSGPLRTESLALPDSARAVSEVEAATGDPTREGLTVPIEPQAAPPAGTPGVFSGPALRTDAVTSAYVDPTAGVVYSATRTAAPALLFVNSLSNGAQQQKTQLPSGVTGSWEMTKSGTLLAIGASAAANQHTTWIVGYDTAKKKLTKSVPLAGANTVMALVEDTFLHARGNGRYFWAGTYDASGAKLFLIDLLEGTATNYTPGNAWKSLLYVRSLASSPAGLTIGMGNPAAVWRLGPGETVPVRWTAASAAVAGHSLAYSVVNFTPTDPERSPSTLVGTEGGASLQLIDPATGSSQRAIAVPGNTVDRITVDDTNATAWFTTRPEGTLYSLDLATPDSQAQERATPVPGSETRELRLAPGGLVVGITGTSEKWVFDPANGHSGTPIDLVTAGQEPVDAVPQGVVPFANRVLVAGHWRYQVHGDANTSRVRVPGEPKAQTVVDGKLYAAVYPSASIYQITDNLTVGRVTSISNGQMRPAAMEYSLTLGKLVVATGPEYGKYGGGISLVPPALGATAQVFTRPVGDQQVTAIQPMQSDILFGTSSNGEARPVKGTARVVRWNPSGNDQTGTTLWSTPVPGNANKVLGLELIDDPRGGFLLAAAQVNGQQSSWLFAIDPASGSVLWQRTVPALVTSLDQADGFVTARVGNQVLQLGASRSGLATARIRNLPMSAQPAYATPFVTSGTNRSVAYVTAGGDGVAGVSAQNTPRVAHRIAGNDRYSTAVAVSQQAFSSASTVVLARGDDFADALAAGPLASALDAPILLVKNGSLTPETRAEITRLGAKTAVPVGGIGAIPDSVGSSLPAGTELEGRLSGATRYDTSVSVAKRLEQVLGGAKLSAMATTGTNFADAISAVPAAIAKQRSIVLFDNVPAAAAAKRFLAERSVEALGGPAAAGAKNAGIRLSATVSGADRFATAKLIADRYFGRTGTAFLSAGLDFPDGLAAGVLAGRQKAPLLLSRADGLTAPTIAALRSGHGTRSQFLVGGIGVLQTRLEQAIADLE